MSQNLHNFVPDSSVYPMHYNTPEEEGMREGFVAAASAVCDEAQLYNKDGSSLLAGIELELALLDNEYRLASQEQRDAVIHAVPNTSVELSAHQLEVTPVEPADLKHDLMSLQQGMESAVQSVRAVTQPEGLRWLRMGSYPLCHIREVDHTKGQPKYIKYERSPQWHEANQRESLETYLLTAAGPLDVSSGYVVGLMNALQITVDSTGFDDAIDKLNRSFMIAPMAVAIGAHASHLGYLDTGYSDVRFIAWRISHDTRIDEEVARGFPTRVGLPTSYFAGLNDYFNQILSYPFVMNDPISTQYPFEVGNGIFWRDARLKFFRDKKTVGIEFRPVAVQPSMDEDIAMMLFYIGRLLWSQKMHEPLLPMNLVWENKESAMALGMRSSLHTMINGNVVQLPAFQALDLELERAEKGLSFLESDSAKRVYYVNQLRERLVNGSPAERFINASKKRLARNIEGARANLISVIEELHLVEG